MRAKKDEAATRVELVGPAPRYLHTHLDFIYYACMVPYKRESLLDRQDLSDTKIGWIRAAVCLQKVTKIFFYFRESYK